jgi:hypothetical protein
MKNNECMTVADLILELSNLDPKMKIVVPAAPYGQPNYLYRIGSVILKEDDLDTGVESGMYIGLNIGNDLDDDTVLDEEFEIEEIHEESPKEDKIIFSHEELADKIFEDLKKTFLK